MIDHLLHSSLSSSHGVTHLILTTTLGNRNYHYFHCIDEETKVQSH